MAQGVSKAVLVQGVSIKLSWYKVLQGISEVVLVQGLSSSLSGLFGLQEGLIGLQVGGGPLRDQGVPKVVLVQGIFKNVLVQGVSKDVLVQVVSKADKAVLVQGIFW